MRCQKCHKYRAVAIANKKDLCKKCFKEEVEERKGKITKENKFINKMVKLSKKVNK